MPNLNPENNLRIIWEYVEDLDAGDILRRAVQLIMIDSQDEGGKAIDKAPHQGLNEEAHAESANKTQPRK